MYQRPAVLCQVEPSFWRWILVLLKAGILESQRLHVAICCQREVNCWKSKKMKRSANETILGQCVGEDMVSFHLFSRWDGLHSSCAVENFYLYMLGQFVRRSGTDQVDQICMR